MKKNGSNVYVFHAVNFSTNTSNIFPPRAFVLLSVPFIECAEEENSLLDILDRVDI